MAVTHQHTEECVIPEHAVFTCEKEEHIHTDECYDYTKEAIDAADEEKEAATVEDDNVVVFDETAGDVNVTVKADIDAFPEGTTMTVTPVDNEDIMDTVTDTLGDKQIVTVKAVDITFWSNGEEVEPSKPITVSMSSAPEGRANESAVIHIDNEGTADIVAETDNVEEELTFDTDSFSVYVMTYTVDFEYEVDGKVYTFSMTGGDAVSFKALVETLHLLDGTDKDVETFMADIQNIEFSDPELVSVVKVANNSTLGALKQLFDLECEYSDELAQFEIDEMNGKVFYSPDWALVSLKPFNTPESITVTMKKGETFTINVTDAQLEVKAITADGTGFVIKVTYDDDAGIPEGAELFARELPVGTEEYNKYLDDSVAELGYADKTDIESARFFDIEIKKDGEKIEPTKPVKVQVEYADAVDIGENTLNVVHFAKEGTEVITDAELSEDGKELVWNQDSFSVTGTIVSLPSQQRSQNMVIVADENPVTGTTAYYIVNNDGSLTNVDYNNGTVTVNNSALHWSFDANTSPNRHIYFNAEATGFGTNMVAADTYRRYLDANALDATTEETDRNPAPEGYVTVSLRDNNPAWWQNDEGVWVHNCSVSNRNNALAATRLFVQTLDSSEQVDGNPTYRIFNQDSGYYIGVERNADGTPIRLKGRESQDNSVKFVLAHANQISPDSIGPRNHTVDHIDISIDGASEITLPLAIGEYYYYDPDSHELKKWLVEVPKDIKLDAKEVRIEPEDMKHANIQAFKADGTPMPEAFVITGYSSNTTSPQDAPQVRIEGAFKVASCDPIPSYRDENDQAARDARKNSIITYVIGAEKDVTFTFEDEEHGTLYEMVDGELKELTLTVPVNLSASFNFFMFPRDEEGNLIPNPGDRYHDQDPTNDPVGPYNSCPGLYDPYQNPQTQWFQYAWTNTMAGMDFELGGDANENNKIVAIEIRKMVLSLDEFNSSRSKTIQLDPSSTYTQSFGLYESITDDCNNVVAGKTGSNVPENPGPTGMDEVYPNYSEYNPLRSENLNVSESGMGWAFDYAVKSGYMYYVDEDTNSVPETILDKDGNTWYYVETRIDTEYVWRNDGIENSRHQSPIYTDLDQDTYRSVPDVVGEYHGKATIDADNYNSETWTDTEGKTGNYYNGFLEFYVYNVYTRIDLDIVKLDAGDMETPLAGAKFKLTPIDENEGTPGTGSESDPTELPEATVSFNGLKPGYYKVEETQLPDGGYIKLDDGTVYIKVTDTSISLLQKTDDPAPKNWPIIEATPKEGSTNILVSQYSNGKVVLEFNTDTLLGTLKVGNPKGAELPQTGGIGTYPYQILGGLLIMLGAILLRIRRKKGGGEYA